MGQETPDSAPRPVFTIDVEDWYQGVDLPRSAWEGKESRVQIGLDVVLELLRRYRTRGTFFILGWLAERHPEIVRKIAESGHEIGSHGYAHDRVHRLSPAAFREEIRKTKGLLESVSGRPVLSHRSAYFSIDQTSLWALDILREEGFLYDCSISPVRTWHYGIAGAPEAPYRIRENGLIEFPISTFSLFSRKLGIGGGYFRIFPYWMTERGLEGSLARHGSAMFYAHPWEFDPGQPFLSSIDFKIRLTHYFNLRACASRTERLLKRFHFQPLGEAVEGLDQRGAIPAVSLSVLN